MLEGDCRSIEDSEALCNKVVVDPLKTVNTELQGGCRSIEDGKALCYKVVVDPLKIVMHCATRWL